MTDHVLLGLRIGQKLTCRGIDAQRSDPAKAAFSRQGEDDGDGPVNPLTDGQLRGVAAELRAEMVHDILRDPLAGGKRCDIQWLGDMDIDIQSAFAGKRQGGQMGYHVSSLDKTR